VHTEPRLSTTQDNRLDTLAVKWTGVKSAERSNYQLYLSDLCDALGVERPRPAGTGYCFEEPVQVINRDGTESWNYIDLWKKDHFVLEAKDQAAESPDSVLLRKAFGQAKSYASDVESGPPPYLMVLDVGKTLIVWDRWSGSYGGFSAGRRIPLAALADRPDDIALLRDIWDNPAARDPRQKAARVTREIAAALAQLASSLEQRGHRQEEVARFLIRCVFTMFSEDVGLLPGEPFTHAIDEVGFTEPEEFSAVLAGLWRAMDTGGRFGLKKFLRFNGHFFADQTVLPLTRADMAVLHQAAMADWAEVEPSIMGTLLTRALDRHERHRLGAEYTPREFVERVVRPTVEEPIRERWTAVQAEVLQLRNTGTKSVRTQRDNEKTALERLRGFHEWLRGLQFLDPACGSGNFLYVTLDLVKQIELEVFRAIEEITGHPELAVQQVDPSQFHGIEVKAWARELAELTLWVGYHQWWRKTHGHVQPPEPVLRDTGTLEHRDAVLAWESIKEDPARSRPDPTRQLLHHVTGELVPDPAAELPYLEYMGARPAAWPDADFIVGNPPYIGNKRMREALGDGYVDALRRVCRDVPESADYVMYWWSRAAAAVSSGRTLRAGLITTNSITQTYNRAIVSTWADAGARVVWTIPSHPWLDETDSAAVRVAMTVISAEGMTARRIEVDDSGKVVAVSEARQLNADLTTTADVAATASVPLLANSYLASGGFSPQAGGFVLEEDEGLRLLDMSESHAQVVRPYIGGRDVASRRRNRYLIDFGFLTEEEAASQYPVLFDIVRDRVRPVRSTNKRKSYRELWWRLGEPRPLLRAAIEGLPRMIATPYVARHRYFTFLEASVAPDDTLICVASDSAYLLGVLSSRVHQQWALAAGSRLGIGNDPRYNKSRCFDSFPFPDATPAQQQWIADLAVRIDDHRRAAVARSGHVTITSMYNVVEKLRTGDLLSAPERSLHEVAACGVLRDLHDTLDHAVCELYGFPLEATSEELVSRIVALHDERVAEERSGRVRWLRSEFQALRAGKIALAEGLDLETDPSEPSAAVEKAAWPAGVVDQVRILQELLQREPLTAEEAAARLRGARVAHVARHLETLELLGEARRDASGAFHAVSRAAA
jgi:hypothetical protein